MVTNLLCGQYLSVFHHINSALHTLMVAQLRSIFACNYEFERTNYQETKVEKVD